MQLGGAWRPLKQSRTHVDIRIIRGNPWFFFSLEIRINVDYSSNNNYDELPECYNLSVDHLKN